MNELQVVVKQEVGKINWNFEELKTALATEMKKYTGIVFDDDSIADAKKTVAYGSLKMNGSRLLNSLNRKETI